MNAAIYIAECIGLLVIGTVLSRGLESWVTKKEKQLAQRNSRKALPPPK